MVRCFALLSGIVLALGLCRAAWAGPRLEYPRPCPKACVPNVGGFGYFPTTWRQWPGESRLEQTNPRSVGVEVLPTPEGQEQVPLPRGTAPSQPRPPLPEGILPPSGETTLPLPGGTFPPLPGGTILPPQTPGSLPEPPAEPKSEKPSNSLIEGGLPGLPVEPDQSPVPKPFEGGQPKEETKSKEQPKPKDTPKPPKTDKSPPGARRERTERTTTAAALFDRRDMPDGTVISLAAGQQSESSDALPGAHRADSIAATTSESPANAVEAAAYTTAESAARGEVTDDNVAVPSIALGGYCPVELIRNGRWTRGDLRWTVVHNGWIYRLSGPTERRQFLANPDAFTPAYSGNDPVLAVDEHRTAPGQATCCATYNGRLYMFSNAATQSQFNRNPQRYAVGK